MSAEDRETLSLGLAQGDEFTVRLTNLRDVQDAGTVARRIVEAISKRFLIEGREVFISTSVRIAMLTTLKAMGVQLAIDDFGTD
ncbi:MAG: hypothetical protein ABI988_07040 [Nitrospirota bacterium]